MALQKIFYQACMQPVIYKDFWIRIIGSLGFAYAIDAMGRPESFFQRLTTSQFYIDLLGGFVMTCLIWEITRRSIIYLDKKYDWLKQTAVRLLWQLLFALIVPALLSFLLTYLFMQLVWQQDIFRTQWLYNEFFLVLLFILFVNFLYFTFWLFYQKKEVAISGNLQPETSSNPQHGIIRKPTTIEVTKGEKIILLPVDTISYAYLKVGYCYIKTGEDVFVTTYALDDLYNMLYEEQFFRANRQMIINRKACKAYTSIENGKIKVELEPLYKGDCIVSQKRAKFFREWIGKAVSV